MLTVGDKFPTFALTAVKGGKEGLGGPGVSFTEITNETDAGRAYNRRVVYKRTDK